MNALKTQPEGIVGIDQDYENAQGKVHVAFSIVADDIIARQYDATGLAAGNHDYKVIPRNSRGPGPESAVAMVAVA